MGARLVVAPRDSLRKPESGVGSQSDAPKGLFQRSISGLLAGTLDTNCGNGHTYTYKDNWGEPERAPSWSARQTVLTLHVRDG